MSVIDKIIRSTLLCSRKVFLPDAGTLYIEYKGAKRISDSEIMPPHNLVAFSCERHKDAPSVVDKTAQAGGIEPSQADELYRSWLCEARHKDGSILIQGENRGGKRILRLSQSRPQRFHQNQKTQRRQGGRNRGMHISGSSSSCIRRLEIYESPRNPTGPRTADSPANGPAGAAGRYGRTGTAARGAAAAVNQDNRRACIPYHSRNFLRRGQCGQIYRATAKEVLFAAMRESSSVAVALDGLYCEPQKRSGSPKTDVGAPVRKDGLMDLRIGQSPTRSLNVKYLDIRKL